MVWYVSILVSWSITFLFGFWQKKCSKIFAISNALFGPSCTNFITNIKHGIWGWKKVQGNICWSSEMSTRGTFSKLFEISKNLKNCVMCLKFQCPRCGQMILKLINLASLNVEFHKLIWNNQNLCFLKIFIVAYFLVDALCVGVGPRMQVFGLYCLTEPSSRSTTVLTYCIFIQVHDKTWFAKIKLKYLGLFLVSTWGLILVM